MTEPVNRQKEREETAAIRFMIHQRLKTRTVVEAVPDPLAVHLDADAICSFVEGRLEAAESAPMISHLVGCSFCRQTTAQLIRLESQFDSETDSTTPDESPGRLRLIFERLASGLTPSVEEDVVFAYQNPETDAGQSSDVSSPATPVNSKQTESTAESDEPPDQ